MYMAAIWWDREVPKIMDGGGGGIDPSLPGPGPGFGVAPPLGVRGECVVVLAFPAAEDDDEADAFSTEPPPPLCAPGDPLTTTVDSWFSDC